MTNRTKIATGDLTVQCILLSKTSHCLKILLNENENKIYHLREYGLHGSAHKVIKVIEGEYVKAYQLITN